MNESFADFLIALGGILLGGGGVAGWLRASGQNRVDFYQAQAERIAKIEARSDDQDKRNETLAMLNAELQGKLGAVQAERSGMDERLKTQRMLIDELNQRVARLGSLEEENVTLRQMLQLETSKREFLEREVHALRQELDALRGRLGDRTPTEVPAV